MNNDLNNDQFETFEDVCSKLLSVEIELSKRFSKSITDIRSHLFELDQKNELEEDDLVARWHEFYARMLAWKRFNESK